MLDEFDTIFPADFVEKLKQRKLDEELKHSMDASDPSSSTQPGNNNEPVPSSGFPEVQSFWNRILKKLGV